MSIKIYKNRRPQMNYYCDESRHIEKDEGRFMLLGTTYCFADDVEEITNNIKQIKLRNHINPYMEMKWSKLSPKNVKAYKELIEYFIDKPNLCFRTIIINKDKINHKKHKSTHEDFYYKMYYCLLDNIINPLLPAKIYIDEKDTNNAYRAKTLRTCLAHEYSQISACNIAPIQVVKSHTIILMSVTDILLGAISYALNNPNGKSKAKHEIVSLIEQHLEKKINKQNTIRTNSFDLFFWRPKEEL